MHNLDYETAARTRYLYLCCSKQSMRPGDGCFISTTHCGNHLGQLSIQSYSLANVQLRHNNDCYGLRISCVQYYCR